MDLTLEPSEHVIYEGVLNDLPIGRLESGESREVENGVCFLAFGRFYISAHARIVGVPRADARAGSGRLTAIVRAEG